MEIKQLKKKLVTGLRCYCKSNGFNDVILGLSGGLDSALVLAIACEALGGNHVHTLMMRTKYTSKESIDLAQKAAQLNNANHQIIDIQNAVDNLIKCAIFNLKNPITEQNIQARVRGNILMMYSNEFGYLPLACSNKSEIAMGYCTLYGDTCGGLAPIGDIYKTTAYQLADFYNQEGKFFIPQEIINRKPTAELAPNQKDTDSLPSYEVLDDILKKYVFDNKIPNENQKILVQSIQKKYHQNAFKQQQLPPAILVY